MNNEQNKMNNEQNKPIEAEELTEKELEGIVGGRMNLTIEADNQTAVTIMVEDRARGFLHK